MSTPVQRSCYKCGFHAETEETVCPRCKRILHTATATRIRGSLLAILGASLTAFMAYLTIWALAAFNAADSSGPKFTGNEQQKLLILGLFGVLIVFGITSFATGVWQLIFGRRNKVFVWLMVAVALLIALGCGIVVWSL